MNVVLLTGTHNGVFTILKNASMDDRITLLGFADTGETRQLSIMKERSK